MKHNRRIGFTLIELLVVVAVLGIVAGGILIALNIGGVIGKASLTKAKIFSSQLERGLILSQVGKWSFEDGTDATIFNDTSGYTNNGSCSGGFCPTWQSKDQCELGFGECFSFDGTSDYVQIAPSSTLQPPFPFSVSAWVKTDSLGTTQPIFMSGYSEIDNGQNRQAGFMIRIQDTGKIKLFVGTNGACSSTHRRAFDTTTALETGKWYHVVGVLNNIDNMQAYINGAADTMVPDNGTAITIGYDVDNPSKIGNVNSCGDGGNWFFDGSIDEVQLYKEALTLSQVNQLYVQGWLRHALAYR